VDPELIAAIPRRHVGLIGMMGSGKTTIGRRVARELDREFVDSDALVVERTGLTVPQMFERHGEPWFREQESAALEEALRAGTPIVLAVAGGAVLAPGNRELLRRHCTVVWLRATPETIISRVGDGKGRPLLADDPEGSIRRYDALRRPIYTEAADMVVDVDGISVGRATTRVLRALAG
jgi:shikimate kinase